MLCEVILRGGLELGARFRSLWHCTFSQEVSVYGSWSASVESSSGNKGDRQGWTARSRSCAREIFGSNWISRVCFVNSHLFLFIYLAALGLHCGMPTLVPWPGIQPGPPALGVQNLNCWKSLKKLLIDMLWARYWAQHLSVETQNTAWTWPPGTHCLPLACVSWAPRNWM